MAVTFVTDLDASVGFYTEVIGLEVADRDATAALLACAEGTPLILRAMGRDDTRAPGSVGVQYVTWTVGQDELARAEAVLRRRSAYIETRRDADVTVVEGRDPDGIPVMLAHPGPDELPLRKLPPRIYAW
jgi:catechol 2,3-dioxygenase-like lactoylglutathione lyase family enzyme